MRFKVFEAKPKPEETVNLALYEEGGLLLLHAVDNNGEHLPRGNILAITGKGYVRMIQEVHVPGIVTNEWGEIAPERRKCNYEV